MFHLAPSLREMSDGFENPDFDDSAWSVLRVPGSWQMKGLRDHEGNRLYLHTCSLLVRLAQMR